MRKLKSLAFTDRADVYQRLKKLLRGKEYVRLDKVTSLSVSGTRHGSKGLELVHYARCLARFTEDAVYFAPYQSVSSLRRIRAVPWFGARISRKRGWYIYQHPAGHEIKFKTFIRIASATGDAVFYDGPRPWDVRGGIATLRGKIRESFDAWLKTPRKGCPNCGRWVVSTVQANLRGDALWAQITQKGFKVPRCVWHSAVLDDNALIFNARRVMTVLPFKKRASFLRRHRAAFVTAATEHYTEYLNAEIQA